MCVQCLFYTELPFAEDLRQFTFGSLPVEEMDAGSQPPNRKFTPTGDVYIFMCVRVGEIEQAIVREAIYRKQHPAIKSLLVN